MEHKIETVLIELADALGQRATVRQALLFVLVARHDPPGNIILPGSRMTLAKARAQTPIGQSIMRSWKTLAEAGLVRRSDYAREEREQPMFLTKEGRALWDRITA